MEIERKKEKCLESCLLILRRCPEGCQARARFQKLARALGPDPAQILAAAPGPGALQRIAEGV